MDAQQWLNTGHYYKVNDRQIFTYDSGADDRKPILLILHGYPTCCYDYYKALPYLTQHFRVIMHDHLGFGYSDKPQDYSYSLIEQTDMALALWRQLNIKKAHILGHDYGTSVTTEIISRYNQSQLSDLKIESITLCNGSMHIEMAKLRLMQKLLLNQTIGPHIARLSSKKTLARNLKNIFFDASKIDTLEISAIWQMMNHNNGKQVLSQTTQYIAERYKFWHRWIGALQKTDLRINIVWAENDPIAVKEMARTIFKETQNSQLKTLSNLGHFPMMEDPKQWSNAVIESIAPPILKSG